MTLHAIRTAALLVAAAAATHPLMAQTDPALERARRILAAHPLIDGHNDLPWEIRKFPGGPMDVDAYDIRKPAPGYTDLARLAAGGVGGQFWSIYVPGERDDLGAEVMPPAGRPTADSQLAAAGYARVQLEAFDIARRMIAKYPEKLTLAHTAADIDRAKREGKVASLLGMEGGHAIENSLGALRMYYALGARYMTLTHNVTLDWADAALGTPIHGGLTRFGKDVVREMNRLGMIVDISHVAPSVMRDALDVSASPVIFSHSSARALVDHPRNVPDDVLRRVPANGGVVMVTFVPSFVSNEVYAWEKARDAAAAALKGRPPEEAKAARQAWLAAHPMPRATIAQVADHIDHVKAIVGADHVGIGSDFDGMGLGPEGLSDVSMYPALFAELVRRGWSDDDLGKLARENIVRVLRVNEQVAARLQRERAPGLATVAEDRPPAGTP